jgi:hypothetical protein
MSENIKVAIRFWPLIAREECEPRLISWTVQDNSIFPKGRRGKSYTFDHVFDMTTKNNEVFGTIARPIVESCMGGFNGTVIAYGQTSSGYRSPKN